MAGLGGSLFRHSPAVQRKHQEDDQDQEQYHGACTREPIHQALLDAPLTSLPLVPVSSCDQAAENREDGGGKNSQYLPWTQLGPMRALSPVPLLPGPAGEPLLQEMIPE